MGSFSSTPWVARKVARKPFTVDGIWRLLQDLSIWWIKLTAQFRDHHRRTAKHRPDPTQPNPTLTLTLTLTKQRWPKHYDCGCAAVGRETC